MRNNFVLSQLKELILLVFFLAPLSVISQSSDSIAIRSNQSLWELEFSVFGQSLFGDGIKTLPGETSLGIGYEGAVKYDQGKVGLALSGGFWSSKYEPGLTGVSQRLDNISAHYIMFGPFYNIDQGQISFEINPKIGIQRFYFPHLNGNVSIRTELDAGISVGLGVRAKFRLDKKLTLHARLDYMSTVGDEAFKYHYYNGTQTITNTNTLQSISFGVGANLALKSKSTNDNLKSTNQSSLDVSVGAGLNFLIGEGIKNLPGDKSSGYDANATLNFRIGRSGIALTGGFWDNTYDAIGARLNNISAHYISAGPIIPITPKGITKLRVEVVPYIGIQRLYFPHSTFAKTFGLRDIRTNLESGWSAGLAANILIPINPKLDLKVGVNYTSMLTDRSFEFTVEGQDAVINRTPLERLNIGVGVAYSINQKVNEVNAEMPPEKISEMIDQKEEDMVDKDMNDQDSLDKLVLEEKDPMNQPVNTNTDTLSTTKQSVPSTIEPSTTNRPTSSRPIISGPGIGTSNTVYRVQFIALSKDVKVFNDLKQFGIVKLEYLPTKGLYRYMVGESPSKEECLNLLQRIHRNGWPKAFLVKYVNGTRTRMK